jgi:hypothetical protein
MLVEVIRPVIEEIAGPMSFGEETFAYSREWGYYLHDV